MKDFLKRYRISLKILTPVYIGSGQELTKKEYIYDRRTMQAWIPDQGRLLKDLVRRHLSEAFEDYMLNGTEPLLNWMKSQGYHDGDIQKLCAYHLDCSQALENLNRPIAIQQFVKDVYGMPYIPGSSLKGAVRSALLGSKILNGPEEYASLRRDVVSARDVINGRPNKRYLQAEGKKAESLAFHTLNLADQISDAKNDELKGVRISDSVPLSPDHLVLCQKIDVNMERKKNALNTLRESLIPGTTVTFEMTIDQSVCKMDAKDMLQALCDTWNYYQDVYVRKFGMRDGGGNGNLYVGGGCGFGTKTVIYELLEDRDRLQTVSRLMNLKFKKHGHRQDVQRGVSPHMLKCTNYGGKLCEMGKCRMSIEEIGGFCTDSGK